jgi:hypothetical protein
VDVERLFWTVVPYISDLDSPRSFLGLQIKGCGDEEIYNSLGGNVALRRLLDHFSI